MSVGYVYVLSNPAMQGLLKIGFTSRTVEDRVRQLSSATGVPAPFKIEYYCLTLDPEDIEKKVHEHFLSRRAKRNKEFFEITLLEAVRIIDSLIKQVLPDRFSNINVNDVNTYISETSQPTQPIRPRRPREDKPFDPEALRRWQEARFNSKKPV